MVWTMKLHNHVCICIHIGTECAPVTSNSTSVDYVHDLDQQEVAIDDYLDESDSFEDEKWKCANVHTDMDHVSVCRHTIVQLIIEIAVSV